MAIIDIDAAAVTAAENFLEEFLTDQIPEGDFSKGTALRDLTVGAIASIYAFLKQENTRVQNLQSLQTVQNAVEETDSEALDDAVTSILSNWFITRKTGSKARGNVVCHSSQLVDIFVRTSVKFNKTSNLSFTVDSEDTYFVPQEDLIPIVNSDGVITEYQFTLPLISTSTGDIFNIDPGLFVSFDSFSPYVSRVENLDKFTGGRGAETTEEILDRAPTAISVRNLINEKSINSALEEQFPDIQNMIVVGYGDEEMVRDVLTGVANHLAVHIGGASDIYINSNLSVTSTSGLVGGSFKRPDNLSVVFRDLSLTGSRLFTDSPAVEPGDLIRITAGLASVPAEYRVVSVEPTRLFISERTPFPKPTDEEPSGPNQFVSYTIGRIGPTYVDIISDSGLVRTTGQTSRTISTSGRITLPGVPLYGISDVAIVDPDSGEPLKDTSDGFVHFTERVNDTPENIVDPADALQYRLVVNNPKLAQSSRQWAEIIVGPDGNESKWDNKTLRVTYKTLPLLSSINSFISNKFERIVCADVLARGLYPVNISMSINCKLKSSAVNTLDSNDVVTTVVSFINAFDTSTAPIDVSAIMEQIRNTYTDIGVITPFTITYFLSTPTGDFITYSTTDEVIVTDARQVNGPTIDLTALGVSTRLLKYLTSEDNITVNIT